MWIGGHNTAPAVTAPLADAWTESDTDYRIDLLAGADDAESITLTVIGLEEAGDTTGWRLEGTELVIEADAWQHLAEAEQHLLSFTYQIRDGSGLAVDQTLAVTLTGVNDAPTDGGSGLTQSWFEDVTTYSLDLTGGVNDAEGDALTVTGLSLSSGQPDISFGQSGNSLELYLSQFASLTSGQTEVLTFSYQVEDGQGGSLSRTATVNILGSNSEPVVGEPLNLTIDEPDSDVEIDLLANSSDPEGGTLSVGGLGEDAAQNDGWSLSGNKLLIDADYWQQLIAGQQQVLNFSYFAMDGAGGNTPLTAVVTIDGLNDVPKQSYTGPFPQVAEGSGTYSLDLLEGIEDPDTGEVLQIVGLTEANGLTDWIQSGTDIEIDLAAKASMPFGVRDTYQFEYQVQDSQGSSINVTKLLQVYGVNTAPVIPVPQTLAETESGTDFEIDLVAGVTDVDDGALIRASSVTEAGGLTGWTLDGNTVTIPASTQATFNDGEEVTYNFSYNIWDGGGWLLSADCVGDIHRH